MTTPIKLRENIVGVIIPEGVDFVRVAVDILRYNLADGMNGRIVLPPANYRLICVSNSATEEEAKQIVGTVSGWSKVIYYNYSAGGRDYRDIVENAFHTACESLQSLLKSVGLEGKNVAILEIIK